jgi:hypothetical protein
MGDRGAASTLSGKSFRSCFTSRSVAFRSAFIGAAARRDPKLLPSCIELRLRRGPGSTIPTQR